VYLVCPTTAGPGYATLIVGPQITPQSPRHGFGTEKSIFFVEVSHVVHGLVER